MPRPRPFRACLLSLALLALPQSSLAEGRFKLPDGPGVELVYGNCQTCHDLQSVIDSAGIRKGAWDAVLDNMAGFGLRITDDQRQKILDYLGTYMGPNPPDTAAAAQANGAADGATVFADTCAACHQEGGVGKDGEFPPLAGNPDIFLSDDFPAVVVLNGIEGKITVGGTEFDNAMPPFDVLGNDEIAAVIAYVRQSWGNADLRPDGMTDPDPDAVAKLRDKSKTPAEVADLRASLAK